MSAQTLILADEGRAHEFKRWAAAAALVVLAHGGLAGAYLLHPASEDEGAPEAPAIIIDLAPVPVAPASQADLAPGPEMIEAQPAPKPPPQTEKELVESVPEAPVPAEVELPKPEPRAVEKKAEDRPDDQRSDAPPSEQAAPAPRTTAAPRSQQNTALAPAAPSPGSAADRAAIANWRTHVVARIQSVKRYPPGADGAGVVMIAFTIDRSGHLIAKRVTRSSGNHAFDEEALAIISRAAPFPPVPAAIPGSSVVLPVPISFAQR